MSDERKTGKNIINNSNIVVRGDFNLGDRNEETSPPEDKQVLKKEFRELVGRNRIPVIFERLKVILTGNPERSVPLDEVYQLESRHHELSRKTRIGVVTNAEEGIERAKISAALLELINDL